MSSPRIIFSTPFAVISYFLIWFVPDISRGQVLWYLVFYCLFQTLVTVSWALRLPERTGHAAATPCPPLSPVVPPAPALSCPCATAVLPRALLGAHHVHQQGAEREGLGHRLP